MHTTVKKFLNSLVPPFVDPAYVPKDVDKNWSCYKHARPQRATSENENTGTPPISHVYHVCTRQCNIYIYISIYIYIRALSLAGLGVHGLSLSGPMNATFWLKWELAKIAFIVSTFPTWGDQVAFDQQWILVWGCARVTQWPIQGKPEESGWKQNWLGRGWKKSAVEFSASKSAVWLWEREIYIYMCVCDVCAYIYIYIWNT